MKNSTKMLICSSFIFSLSCAAFIGSTFSWFSSKLDNSNVIDSGTLKIELAKYDINTNSYKEVSKEKGLFSIDEDGYWEPGTTKLLFLSIKNSGSLSLKYNMHLHVTDFGLVPALDYAILKDTKIDENNYNYYSSLTWDDIKEIEGVQTYDVLRGHYIVSENGKINGYADDYFVLAVNMDNTPLINDINSAELNISIKSTQYTTEVDDFGSNTYDDNLTIDFHKDYKMYIPDNIMDSTNANYITTKEEFYEAIENCKEGDYKDLFIAAPIQLDRTVNINNKDISIYSNNLENKLTYSDYTTNMFNLTNNGILHTFGVNIDGEQIWDVDDKYRASFTKDTERRTANLFNVSSGSLLHLGESTLIQNFIFKGNNGISYAKGTEDKDSIIRINGATIRKVATRTNGGIAHTVDYSKLLIEPGSLIDSNYCYQHRSKALLFADTKTSKMLISGGQISNNVYSHNGLLSNRYNDLIINGGKICNNIAINYNTGYTKIDTDGGESGRAFMAVINAWEGNIYFFDGTICDNNSIGIKGADNDDPPGNVFLLGGLITNNLYSGVMDFTSATDSLHKTYIDHDNFTYTGAIQGNIVEANKEDYLDQLTIKTA